MAIRYDDEYRKSTASGCSLVVESTIGMRLDVTDRPQSVAFDGWDTSGPPDLPGRAATWSTFWADGETSEITGKPVH